MRLIPDLGQARAFLEHLTQDCFNPKATFQTFDDNPDRKDPNLVRVLHGTLDKHQTELTRLNNLGAGIFVTVNETNFQGRKKTDIVKVRACWADLDGVAEIPEMPLTPSITVRTGRGWHPYWLFAEEVDTNTNELLNKAIARRLVGDLQATDCARVMRLPGFYHLKNPNKPIMVKVRALEDVFYTRAEIEAAFPRPPQPARKAVSRHMERTSDGHSRYGKKALEAELATMRGAVEGERNHTLNACAFSIGQLIAGGEIDQIPALADLKDVAMAAGLPESEVDQTIASGLRGGMNQPRSAPPRPTRPTLRAVPNDSSVEPPEYLDIPPPSDADGPNPEPYRGEADEPWRKSLRWKVTDKGGTVITSDPGNIALIMTHDPLWKGSLVFDTFQYDIYWMRKPPQVYGMKTPSGDIKDSDALYIQHWFALHYRVKISKDDMFRAIQIAAEQTQIHPVRDYLEGLIWDQTPRLDTWLTDYASASPTRIHQKIASWWMISAVARAMNPGDQVDHTLILEGVQGSGKSSLCRALAGKWYQPNLGDIQTVAGQIQVQGHWIVEIGELEAFRGKAMTAIKNFLTNTVDIYRPPYGRRTIRRPRQCVFIGSTNEEHYLRDMTGNRRFWPVRCGEIKPEAIAEARDQLWAEAVHRYRAGEHWWPELPEDKAKLKDLQEARREDDIWLEEIEEFLEDNRRQGVTLKQVLEFLQIHPERFDAHARKIAAKMRYLGWDNRTPRRDEKRIRVWFPQNSQSDSDPAF